jgi:Uma2 family endonuclease
MTLVPPPRSVTPVRGGPTLPLAEAVTAAAIVPLTIGQYLRMVDEQIVPEDGTVELLRGVLVRKDRSSPGEDPMGHGPLHRLIVTLLTDLAARIRTDARFMQIQLPVLCPPDGAPEPDAAVVRGSPRDYADRIPDPADVSCVIEAAHSSLTRDRDDKLPIYAEAGVGQYVILNLSNATVEVYADPDAAAGTYRTKATIVRGQTLRLRMPDGWFEVVADDVLP